MILKTKEYPLIQEYKNAVDDEMCSLIIDFFEEKTHLQRKGLSGAYVDVEFKNTIDINFNKYVDSMVLSVFKESLHKCLIDYANKNEGLYKSFSYEEKLFNLSECVLKRYTKNEGFYRGHCDVVPADEFSVNRAVSFLLYLNDVEDGGETEFTTLGLKIKPERGKVLMFPPFWTHQHKAHIPKSNDKYVISCWALYLNIMEDENIKVVFNELEEPKK